MSCRKHFLFLDKPVLLGTADNNPAIHCRGASADVPHVPQVPSGTADNSPAIHCRGASPMYPKSRQGRQAIARQFIAGGRAPMCSKSRIGRQTKALRHDGLQLSAGFAGNRKCSMSCVSRSSAKMCFRKHIHKVRSPLERDAGASFRRSHAGAWNESMNRQIITIK